MNNKNFSILIILLSLTLSLAAFGHGDDKHESSKNPLFSGLDTDAAQVVKQFHTALRNGDTALARSVLSDDVLIYESGGAERSAEEYAAGHMKADMNHLTTINSELIEHQVRVNGDIAVSTVRTRNSKSTNGSGRVTVALETIVLTRVAGQWLITHIHWS